MTTERHVSTIILSQNQTILFSNNHLLDNVAPYLIITQDMLDEQDLGTCQDITISEHKFMFLLARPYYFIVVSKEKDCIPFLPLYIHTVKHIAFAVFGPNFQSHRLSQTEFDNYKSIIGRLVDVYHQLIRTNPSFLVQAPQRLYFPPPVDIFDKLLGAFPGFTHAYLLSNHILQREIHSNINEKLPDEDLFVLLALANSIMQDHRAYLAAPSSLPPPIAPPVMLEESLSVTESTALSDGKDDDLISERSVSPSLKSQDGDENEENDKAEMENESDFEIDAEEFGIDVSSSDGEEISVDADEDLPAPRSDNPADAENDPLSQPLQNSSPLRASDSSPLIRSETTSDNGQISPSPPLQSTSKPPLPPPSNPSQPNTLLTSSSSSHLPSASSIGALSQRGTRSSLAITATGKFQLQTGQVGLDAPEVKTKDPSDFLTSLKIYRNIMFFHDEIKEKKIITVPRIIITIPLTDKSAVILMLAPLPGHLPTSILPDLSKSTIIFPHTMTELISVEECAKYETLHPRNQKGKKKKKTLGENQHSFRSQLASKINQTHVAAMEQFSFTNAISTFISRTFEASPLAFLFVNRQTNSSCLFHPQDSTSDAGNVLSSIITSPSFDPSSSSSSALTYCINLGHQAFVNGYSVLLARPVPFAICYTLFVVNLSRSRTVFTQPTQTITLLPEYIGDTRAIRQYRRKVREGRQNGILCELYGVFDSKAPESQILDMCQQIITKVMLHFVLLEGEGTR
ncbi:hypothetical protein BLNAU_10440 [Blattamonas nauphoetae]|uniref:CCZ1/INTU/HSP4 first Longin domain-containing protein n=1 Tax=Blattamonas nauphoetae TaxID=2049346 RepID=A0ABQ9XRQ3_9EUKA|nr:hypothetical protein BLNAU_10440 [Blattamonas nauphoetae]